MLEAFFEENELEFEDVSANQCETILIAMLFEDLLEKLHQQSPDLTPIFEMLYDGKSQYAITELIVKPQTTVNYMIKRMRIMLKQQVNREDLARKIKPVALQWATSLIYLQQFSSFNLS